MLLRGQMVAVGIGDRTSLHIMVIGFPGQAFAGLNSPRFASKTTP